MGYPKDENGSLGKTGTIVKHFDLKKLGLAWEQEFTTAHLDLVNEVKAVLMDS